jgi:MarR family 2-MHQ and catechol resistance regulon transcriptional repressor
MMKAMRAQTRYAAAGIEETVLGLSDFGVLEILLHKGPWPVNTIGPIVDLTPGSISTAVDRLVAKGLVRLSDGFVTKNTILVTWMRSRHCGQMAFQ